MVVAGGERGDPLPCPGDVALADVQQDEDRLLGQEPEAADRLLLVGVEARRRGSASRPRAPALSRPRTASSRSFASRSAGVPWRPLCLQPLEAALDEGEVGQDELGVEPVEIAGRVDRALRMRVGRVLERADDVEQRVRVAEPGEVLGRQVLRPDVALRRGRRRGQVDVGDVGLDDLLRLEDLGEPVEPLVGHLDDADVELHPAEPAGLGVAPGQRVEDGRLARSGKTDDGDLHGAMLPDTPRSAAAQAEDRAVSSPRSGRRR